MAHPPLCPLDARQEEGRNTDLLKYFANYIMAKKSIRFYNDYKVRAVWDDDHSKWWFSATDIVRAINDEPDYVKAGNYWRWLKKKLATAGIQLVSDTHEFKFMAPDGKQRVAYATETES
jgi:cell filamentation protein